MEAGHNVVFAGLFPGAPNAPLSASKSSCGEKSSGDAAACWWLVDYGSRYYSYLTNTHSARDLG